MQNVIYEFFHEVPGRRVGIVQAFAFGVCLSDFRQDLQCLFAGIVSHSGHVVVHPPYTFQLKEIGNRLFVSPVWCVKGNQEVLEEIEAHSALSISE